jgi:hypothetical protein
MRVNQAFSRQARKQSLIVQRMILLDIQYNALIYLPKCDIINSLIIGIKRRTIAEIKKGVLVLYVE